MSHVNIVKKIKIDGDWKLLSIPRNAKGNYDWNALPEVSTSSNGALAAKGVGSRPASLRRRRSKHNAASDTNSKDENSEFPDSN